MQGRKDIQPKMMYEVNIDMLVLADNFYRKLAHTVEPVMGTLINFLNMRRLNSRGMASAHKHVLLSAMCYNPKKLMKFDRPKVPIVTNALHEVTVTAGELLHFLKRVCQAHIFQF